MSSAVKDAIVDYLAVRPDADNEEVAAHVRATVPGAQTTGASVSSVKSHLRREGHELPRARYGGSVDGSPSPSPLASFLGGQRYGVDALPEFDPDETLEQAMERINIRYDAMERMARRLVQGSMPSLIVSGPPGLGKSYTVRRALAERWPEGPESFDDEGNPSLHYDVISGSVSAVGLYQALWRTRNGGVLMLDDLDEVFRDEVALNLLKGALDSGPVRSISWRKEARWLEELGIPDRFEFRGHVVFLTNLDFEVAIRSGKRDSEHLKALVDRSMYLCLTLRTRRDFMIRIRQVSEGPEGMLAAQFGCSPEEAEEVLSFVADNQTRFYNLSLRLVGQAALAYKADPDSWRKDIEAAKMRTLS